MTRGTTPDIVATLTGVSLNNAVALYVTLQQGSLVVQKTLDDVIIDGTDIHIVLTQEETLSFSSDSTAKIQIRGLLEDDRAFATNIGTIPVNSILKEGVI